MGFYAGKKSVELKQGTRFVHRHYLADGVKLQDVRQDPDNPDFYAIFEVTAVICGRVYYRHTGTEGPAQWLFDQARAADYVRKVL